MTSVCSGCGTPLGSYRKQGVCQTCYSISQQEKLNKTQEEILRIQRNQRKVITQDASPRDPYLDRLGIPRSPSVSGYPVGKPGPLFKWDEFGELFGNIFNLVGGSICIYLAFCILVWSGKALFWMLTLGFVFGRQFPHLILYWF
jgi:hypothetical protein